MFMHLKFSVYKSTKTVSKMSSNIFLFLSLLLFWWAQCKIQNKISGESPEDNVEIVDTIISSTRYGYQGKEKSRYRCLL